MQLIITRVDGPLFNGPAYSVTLPGAEGEMTVLPEHEPVISPLTAGAITIRSADGEQTINIEKGTLEVSDNQVTVLV